MKPEEIHCIQAHDVKEAVYELTANSKFACFISQGNGVKVRTLNICIYRTSNKSIRRSFKT